MASTFLARGKHLVFELQLFIGVDPVPPHQKHAILQTIPT